MIIDTLDNFRQYLSVNPLFEKVAEFISQNDLAGMDEGKYPILGDNLFVTITGNGRYSDSIVMSGDLWLYARTRHARG